MNKKAILLIPLVAMAGCGHIQSGSYYSQPKYFYQMAMEGCCETPQHIKDCYQRKVIDFDVQKVANKYLKDKWEIKVYEVKAFDRRNPPTFGYTWYEFRQIWIWYPTYAVFLHELAHAINFERYKTTGHIKTFCEILDYLYKEVKNEDFLQ